MLFRMFVDHNDTRTYSYCKMHHSECTVSEYSSCLTAHQHNTQYHYISTVPLMVECWNDLY